MNITLEGKVYKEADQWTVELSIFDTKVSSPSILRCVHEVLGIVRNELSNPDCECSVRIGEDYKIFLVLEKCAETMDYLSEKALQNTRILETIRVGQIFI